MVPIHILLNKAGHVNDIFLMDFFKLWFKVDSLKAIYILLTGWS